MRHVKNSRNFDPRRRLGDKCKAQLAEPSKELGRMYILLEIFSICKYIIVCIHTCILKMIPILESHITEKSSRKNPRLATDPAFYTSKLQISPRHEEACTSSQTAEVKAFPKANCQIAGVKKHRKDLVFLQGKKWEAIGRYIYIYMCVYIYNMYI